MMPQPQIRVLKVTTPNAGSELLKRTNGHSGFSGLTDIGRKRVQHMRAA